MSRTDSTSAIVRKQQPFIRLGSLGINISDIISYDLNHTDYQMVEGERTSVSFVRIVTREQTYTDVGIDGWINTSKEYLFKHGTPEANALVIWLTNHSQDLLNPQHFYITMNLYGGHIKHLAEAAQARHAQLVAVDYLDIRHIPEHEQGYRDALAYYLFVVSAPSLDQARELVEEIEQLKRLIGSPISHLRKDRHMDTSKIPVCLVGATLPGRRIR